MSGDGHRFPLGEPEGGALFAKCMYFKESTGHLPLTSWVQRASWPGGARRLAKLEGQGPGHVVQI